MRLSHKNKLLHKKGIPQRAWIGRKNRELLRWTAKVNFAAANAKWGTFKLGKGGGKFGSDNFFARAILRRKKRTGEVVFNAREMMLRGIKRHIEKQFAEVHFRTLRGQFCTPDSTNLVLIDPLKIAAPGRTMPLPFSDETAKFDMPNEIEGRELIPMRERASGGFISPEMGIQSVPERELRAVITPNDKASIAKSYVNRQQTIVNRVVVTAKEEEANAGSVLSAIARSAVRVGSALKGVFFSKSKEKGTL